MSDYFSKLSTSKLHPSFLELCSTDLRNPRYLKKNIHFHTLVGWASMVCHLGKKGIDEINEILNSFKKLENLQMFTFEWQRIPLGCFRMAELADF